MFLLGLKLKFNSQRKFDILYARLTITVTLYKTYNIVFICFSILMITVISKVVMNGINGGMQKNKNIQTNKRTKQNKTKNTVTTVTLTSVFNQFITCLNSTDRWL